MGITTEAVFFSKTVESAILLSTGVFRKCKPKFLVENKALGKYNNRKFLTRNFSWFPGIFSWAYCFALRKFNNFRIFLIVISHRIFVAFSMLALASDVPVSLMEWKAPLDSWLSGSWPTWVPLLIAIILIRGEDLSEDGCVVTMHQGNQSILSSTVSYIYLLLIEFEVRTVSYGPTLFSFIFAGLKFGEHFLGTFHESLQCDYSNRGHPTKFSANLTNKNRG